MNKISYVRQSVVVSRISYSLAPWLYGLPMATCGEGFFTFYSCPLNSTDLNCPGPFIRGFFFTENIPQYCGTHIGCICKWRADCKVYSGFLTAWWSVSLTAMLFKGQL